MEHLFNDELLIRFLTETATSEEIEQVEQWCVQSDENQRTLEQLYFTIQASNRLKVIQMVNSNEALINIKERIKKQKKSIRRRIIIQYFQRVAAILLLPLVVAVWLLLQKNEISAQYIELHSNPGMVASFELPDGSKVWLNGGSILRYPNIFKGKNREVEMSGQGYFEIVHNARQPFSVRTSETFSLEVLGTSFNLSAYNDENIIEATLVEGSVRLKLLQEGKLVQHVMKPNEKVIYTKNEKMESVIVNNIPPKNTKTIADEDKKPELIKIATVDPQYDIAWKDRQILFRNHPMEEVIRTLGRYYNVKFVVKNNQVMDSRITGKFSNEQLPQVMDYLKIASGIKYNIVPSTLQNGEMISGVVEIWK